MKNSDSTAGSQYRKMQHKPVAAVRCVFYGAVVDLTGIECCRKASGVRRKNMEPVDGAFRVPTSEYAEGFARYKGCCRIQER